MDRILLIAAGAALGANARYWIGVWAVTRWGMGFPHGTLIVNVSGSLLLGFLVALGAERLPASWRLLLATGFCGSYTTFSTYAVESVDLVQSSAPWLGWINVIGSNLLALAAVLVGVWLARLAHP